MIEFELVTLCVFIELTPQQLNLPYLNTSKKIMNLDINSDDCGDWLKRSLEILKNAQVDYFLQNENLLPIRSALIAALYERDIDTVKVIYQQLRTANNDFSNNIKDLILPAVYAIEQDWTSGKRTFSQTVLAFWQLQMLLEYDIKVTKEKAEGINKSQHGNIVFAAAPGCEHNIGVLVLTDFFRSCGWHVYEFIQDSANSITNQISNHLIDFLGISVGHDEALLGLADHIKNFRSVSKNPSLRIILGGNVFDMRASEYDWIGADYIAYSPNEALQYCLINKNHRSLSK